MSKVSSSSSSSRMMTLFVSLSLSLSLLIASTPRAAASSRPIVSFVSTSRSSSCSSRSCSARLSRPWQCHWQPTSTSQSPKRCTADFSSSTTLLPLRATVEKSSDTVNSASSSSSSLEEEESLAPSVVVVVKKDAPVDDSLQQQQQQYHDVYEFNEVLNRMTESIISDSRTGKFWIPAMAVDQAAACEQLWKQQQQLMAAAASDSAADSNSDSSVVVVQPDTVSFNTVLKGWSKCCQVLADRKLLEQTGYASATGGTPTSASPTTATTSTTTASTTSAAATSTAREEKRWLSTHVHDRHHVDIYTAKDAAQHALNLLHSYEDEKQQQQQVDFDSSSAAAVAAAPIKVIPDVTSYNIVMDAWAKVCRLSGTSNSNSAGGATSGTTTGTNKEAVYAVEQVESLLKRLLTSPHLKPDLMTFNAYIDAQAYSNLPNALDKLHQILKYMTTHAGITPTVRTMNSMLNAYARQVGLPETTAEQAQQLVQDAEALLRNDPHMKEQADVLTYTTLMDVHSKAAAAAIAVHKQPGGSSTSASAASGTNNNMMRPNYSQALQHAMSAERLFHELQHLHRTSVASNNKDTTKDKDDSSSSSSSNKDRYEPTVYTYTTLLQAWSRTQAIQAPDKADAILQEMYHTKNCIPNARAVTAAITCWGRSKFHQHEEKKALKALEYLQQMKKVGKEYPSIGTYNAALDCCSRVREPMPGAGGGATGAPDNKAQLMALKIALAIFKAIQVDEHLPGTTVKTNQKTFQNLLKCVQNCMPASEERCAVAKAVFEKAVAAGQVDRYVLQNFQNAVNLKVAEEVLECLLVTASVKDSRDQVHTVNTQHKFDYRRIPSAWTKNLV